MTTLHHRMNDKFLLIAANSRQRDRQQTRHWCTDKSGLCDGLNSSVNSVNQLLFFCCCGTKWKTTNGRLLCVCRAGVTDGVTDGTASHDDRLCTMCVPALLRLAVTSLNTCSYSRPHRRRGWSHWPTMLYSSQSNADINLPICIESYRIYDTVGLPYRLSFRAVKLVQNSSQYLGSRDG